MKTGIKPEDLATIQDLLKRAKEYGGINSHPDYICALVMAEREARQIHP